MNANNLILAAANTLTLTVANILGTNDVHTVVNINGKKVLDTDDNM